MFAIIKTGGKQIKVEPGQEIFVEKIKGDVDAKVVFDQVLMIDGKVGNPLISGAKVLATIIKQGKAKKIRVVRYHPKKNVNKIYGHRQPFTKVKIDEITTK
ncbi:50S ribosomal protein L21 [Mycoplasma putrefaciens]|uniref:Large ribosomal subunit protein bL21 n=2 Tax=Mycoplasma putrefaciens TaxID=2123 RepID=M9WCA5_9MOLU|nr:50S ribosomal protein L21 [Mycoplasma putrefaciens]AEM68864.1 ribosomal protein L21 [Mycoplasma putrefaciens KS1]AGJ90782.1 50s ribosomal protein L21 [Mycoplasma putrefaciens Mput9231]SYV96212.1 50S ribosomal protein L21 [Mycoplasma putrefaciens]